MSDSRSYQDGYRDGMRDARAILQRELEALLERVDAELEEPRDTVPAIPEPQR